MDGMTLFVLLAAAMAAYSLFEGVVSMAHGGEEDSRRANALMFRRTVWQGLAVGLLLLALLSAA